MIEKILDFSSGIFSASIMGVSIFSGAAGNSVASIANALAGKLLMKPSKIIISKGDKQ